MTEFQVFSRKVKEKFEEMKKSELFRVEATKDELWKTYLSSFPEGKDPIFKERTEHDCQCCRSFIRAMADVVTIENGEVVTIWDVEVPNFYQEVTNKMKEFVLSKKIENKFFHFEPVAGKETTHSQDKDGKVLTWNHFELSLPREKVMKIADQGTFLGQQKATFDVLYRSLTTLTMDSIDTVLELIAQNSIYRGEEHKFAVESFRKLKVGFDKLKNDTDRNNYSWLVATSKAPESVLRIRNTAIGTLLTALSEGEELETSVGKFEAMVAPQNYKRPTALVTKKMIDDAKKTISELGLESSLERRYATIEDVSINNILFVDRDSKQLMKDSVFDVMAQEAQSKPQNMDKVEEIQIDKFIADVLPKAESIEVLVENKHLNNFVSLIAPTDANSKNMFKWDNKFSWSYTGEFADSIKERVKKAGGKIDADLRCSLSWFNYDDLDFHMKEPGGYEIYYGNRNSNSPNYGKLDVDMNAGGGHTRQPVENIVYLDRKMMRDGVYNLIVHQYAKRESKDVGFEVEIEFDGNPMILSHEKAVRDREYIPVAQIEKSKSGLKVTPLLPTSTVSKDMWGIKTHTWQKVTTIMNSPNYWDGHGVGNRHFFFMLENCKNESKIRGFYNEFLSAELDKHRKVLEIVGSKMRTEESDRQLSGIGFSTTQRNHLLVKVQGKFTRTLKVLF